MNVFYEEDGAFKAGKVLADQGASLQVESASGKRTKVKSGHVLFDFREPDAETLMRDAQALAGSIDLEFLWECAPQAEFAFRDLAAEYFGRAVTPVESAALVTRLHAAPMYFYRKGRGQYRSAPPEALKAALAGIERKQREAAAQDTYRDALVAGDVPDAIRQSLRELLFRPDKSRVEYKALVEAAAARRTTPERLLLDSGAIVSPLALHRDRFAFAQFPRGTGFPGVLVPSFPELPTAAVVAFSIDDADTTEIDDAFSVTTVAPGRWRVGIHIAAPGLAIRRGDAIDTLARERFSTVYAPGEKITMLPDAVVAAFTLAAGRASPALSLYVDVSEDGSDDGSDNGSDDGSDHDGALRIDPSASRVERVPVASNLRHDDLDGVVTEESLTGAVARDFAHKDELVLLWRVAGALNEGRQQARLASGLRRESHQRPDHAFRVRTVDGIERVEITERRRGAPLDTIVAELMILANSTWGKLLADRGVAGIYRAQNAAFGPAGRVRMITHPAPHAGLGVAQYAWSTSPLRRYVDLVNQWQIAAAIDGTPPAYAPKDGDLFAIVSGFDAAYGAYAEYQTRMERYWCLRWLAQQGRSVFEARATGRDDNAVLVDVPLHVRVPGMAVVGPAGALPNTHAVTRGQRIEVEIVDTDLVDLAVQCRLVAIIEEVDEGEVDEVDEEALDDAEADAVASVGPAAEAPLNVDSAVDVETAAAERDAASRDVAPAV